MKIITNTKFYTEGSPIDVVIHSRIPQWVLFFDGKNFKFHYTKNKVSSTAKKNQLFLIVIYFSWSLIRLKKINFNVYSFNKNKILVNSNASLNKLKNIDKFPNKIQEIIINRFNFNISNQIKTPPSFNIFDGEGFQKFKFNN